MAVNPIEEQLVAEENVNHNKDDAHNVDYIDVAEPSSDRNQTKDAIAQAMWLHVCILIERST